MSMLTILSNLEAWTVALSSISILCLIEKQRLLSILLSGTP